MSSLSLTNYLRANRKRLALTQEEVAFLLGVPGLGKEAKVCRDENLAREPKLRTALAYEVIYQRPVRELFAGLYEQIEREVVGRAKILNLRKDSKPTQRTAHRRQMLAALAARQSDQPLNPAQK
jgi:transcriptional regulator with XRE-family HTH domain